MTVSLTAAEIARQFVGPDKALALELAILRHMEHHIELAVEVERERLAAEVQMLRKGGELRPGDKWGGSGPR